MNHQKLFAGIIAALLIFSSCSAKEEEESADTTQLLHVSYDIAREIFRNFNDAFIPVYEEETDQSIAVEQSHAGSSRQARAVIDGLPADLVSMNQFLDIQLIHDLTEDQEGGALIPADWNEKYPNNSNPYSSTMAFVVRKGNPKNINDWDDLIREDIEIVAPNYKTTGNGRFSYLTAYAYALTRYQGSGVSEEEAYDFVKKILANTPVLATGGRDATNIFVEREKGDVLLTFESEVNLIVRDLGPEKFEVVVPSFGIDAKMYVVVIEKNARAHGTYEIAQAYWDFIYTETGQEVVAKSYYRPINPTIKEKYKDQLPEVDLFAVEDVFGGWTNAKDVHFSDGGTFDRIYEELGKN